MIHSIIHSFNFNISLLGNFYASLLQSSFYVTLKHRYVDTWVTIKKRNQLIYFYHFAFVLGIQAALKIIVNRNVPSRKITIFFDSQAAIKTLDSSVLNPKTVYDCRRYRNEMAKRYDVCITWIPGNCRAYQLAIELSNEFSTLGDPFVYLQSYNWQCNRRLCQE